MEIALLLAVAGCTKEDWHVDNDPLRRWICTCSIECQDDSRTERYDELAYDSEEAVRDANRHCGFETCGSINDAPDCSCSCREPPPPADARLPDSTASADAATDAAVADAPPDA
jgi:hypothetical protein